MPAATTEQRALDLIRQLRKDGETVERVLIEGRKIEIQLGKGEIVQSVDNVKW